MREIGRARRRLRRYLVRSRPARDVLIARIRQAGWRRHCPVCGAWVRTFLPHGNPPRPQARCPICGSLERHRLDWILFKQSTDLFDGSPKTMLHVAPERFLTDRLDRIENLDYVSADISSPLARVKMDITDIRYPDDSFSVIYCSHVLEHVPDDRAALRELYRVLKPGGWAVLQVPITAAETFEDPNVTDPDERARVFGQWDHVRRCGPDYIDRMRAAGFIAETLSATEVIPAGRCARLGIQRDRLIFLCTK